MLMVIFGAGASYDSSPDFPPSAGSEVIRSEPWRPPLTNELFLDTNGSFGDIVLRYPRLHGILPFLRRPQKGRSVEQQLELYMDEAWVDEERKRQLFSVRYYLHDLFRFVSTEWLKRTNGVTNYATLIDQIRSLNTTREPVCLVSFNYDLLLDKAIFPGREAIAGRDSQELFVGIVLAVGQLHWVVNRCGRSPKYHPRFPAATLEFFDGMKQLVLKQFATESEPLILTGGPLYGDYGLSIAVDRRPSEAR